MQKRGYFFTLDALLALGILVVGLVLLFASYRTEAPQASVILPSQDIMNFLAATQIKDINNPYVGLGGELWQQGLIPKNEFTLLEEIGYLYHLGNDTQAAKAIANATESMIPPQYGFEFWMNDELLYPAAEDVPSKNQSAFLYPSRKIVYGFADEEAGEMFGPYIAKVLLWQR